jgi:hypothetical protein
MTGILNYAAPRDRCPKAMTYGILSTGTASLVCALPTLINGAADILQTAFSRPHTIIVYPDESAWIVLGPALAMVMLPLLGLLFAGMSVASSRRDYQCALVGIVVNISGFIAGLGTVALH